MCVLGRRMLLCVVFFSSYHVPHLNLGTANISFYSIMNEKLARETYRKGSIGRGVAQLGICVVSIYIALT